MYLDPSARTLTTHSYAELGDSLQVSLGEPSSQTAVASGVLYVGDALVGIFLKEGEMYLSRVKDVRVGQVSDFDMPVCPGL